MQVALVSVFLCLVVISLSSSAPVNDAPSKSEVKRENGWGVHFNKKRAPPFETPLGSNSFIPVYDHAKNDPAAHWGWKDTASAAGIAADLFGKKDEGLKQVSDDGDNKMGQWAQLAEDLYKVLNDQSDKPANDQVAPDSAKKRTFGGPGDFGISVPQGDQERWVYNLPIYKRLKQ